MLFSGSSPNKPGGITGTAGAKIKGGLLYDGLMDYSCSFLVLDVLDV